MGNPNRASDLNVRDRLERAATVLAACAVGVLAAAPEASARPGRLDEAIQAPRAGHNRIDGAVAIGIDRANPVQK